MFDDSNFSPTGFGTRDVGDGIDRGNRKIEEPKNTVTSASVDGQYSYMYQTYPLTSGNLEEIFGYKLEDIFANGIREIFNDLSKIEILMLNVTTLGKIPNEEGWTNMFAIQLPPVIYFKSSLAGLGFPPMQPLYLPVNLPETEQLFTDPTGFFDAEENKEIRMYILLFLKFVEGIFQQKPQDIYFILNNTEFVLERRSGKYTMVQSFSAPSMDFAKTLVEIMNEKSSIRENSGPKNPSYN